MAKKYGIAEKNTYNYRNFDQIADNPDIDVVYVVLRIRCTRNSTIRAARAGKHVLCEKPMSVSVDEAKQMISECDKAKVKLAVGYRCQFEPHHQECMRIARESSLATFDRSMRHLDFGSETIQ